MHDNNKKTLNLNTSAKNRLFSIILEETKKWREIIDFD